MMMSRGDGDGHAERQVAQWLGEGRSLPPVPGVVQEAVMLLHDASSCAADVANVISRDEVTTARLLRVVNSAFYGLSGRVSTVSHAIALLGFEQVRTLLLGVALFDRGRMSDPLASANRNLVWQHSLACARWSQAVARSMGYRSAEEAFIAGLLHDVGKVVLAVFAPQRFADAVSISQQEGISSAEAEAQAVGIDHIVVGKALSRKWRLPELFHSCIGLHHDPWPPCFEVADGEPNELKQLLAIVRVANSGTRLNTAEESRSRKAQATGRVAPADSHAVGVLAEQVGHLLRWQSARQQS